MKEGRQSPLTPPLVVPLTRQPKQRKKNVCYVKQITKLLILSTHSSKNELVTRGEVLEDLLGLEDVLGLEHYFLNG